MDSLVEGGGILQQSSRQHVYTKYNINFRNIIITMMHTEYNTEYIEKDFNPKTPLL